ncbi:MAG: endonuclease III [Clostridia bacterium]|nr:endonuclease III [Clostridia bacterium]
MKQKEFIEIIENLKKSYPDAKCSLDFTTPFELLIAVMLSAQCTDERVNKTTPALFSKYNTPEDFAKIDINILEELIHPCGFYKNKAKNIKATSQILIEKYNSEVPKNMDDLISLPGVGRKTANVVMLEAFNMPQGVAVDTHCKRISNRIGISNESEPEKIEHDILKISPKEYYTDLNHLLIYHGRATCDSRKPKCDQCSVNTYCKYYKLNQKETTK